MVCLFSPCVASQEETKQKALENLELLKAMGFADEASNRELLRMHRGDVSKVCAYVAGIVWQSYVCVCVCKRTEHAYVCAFMHA